LHKDGFLNSRKYPVSSGVKSSGYLLTFPNHTPSARFSFRLMLLKWIVTKYGVTVLNGLKWHFVNTVMKRLVP